MAPPILVAVLVSITIQVQRRGIKYQLLEFGNEQDLTSSIVTTTVGCMPTTQWYQSRTNNLLS